MKQMIEQLESRRLMSRIIGTSDFVAMAQSFNTSSSTEDLNHDGVVNALDFNILASNFGRFL